MLGELPQEAQPVENVEEIFSPNIENVTAVVNAVNDLLMGEQFADMRVLDILVALDGLSGTIRETLGVVGMTELLEGEDEV